MRLTDLLLDLYGLDLLVVKLNLPAWGRKRFRCSARAFAEFDSASAVPDSALNGLVAECVTLTEVSGPCRRETASFRSLAASATFPDIFSRVSLVT